MKRGRLGRLGRLWPSALHGCVDSGDVGAGRGQQGPLLALFTFPFRSKELPRVVPGGGNARRRRLRVCAQAAGKIHNNVSFKNGAARPRLQIGGGGKTWTANRRRAYPQTRQAAPLAGR